MSRCPDRATLLGLLDEEIDLAGDGPVSRHVASCPGCQEALDDLTRGGPELSLAAALPSPTVADSRSTFLARMKRSMPAPPSWSGREPRDGKRGRRALPVVPGYEVLRELGRGGMGVVYLARQAALNRLVAMKMLRPGGEPQGRERFAQEAESVARLRHPNIVQVYGAGDAEGVPYLVLEYVEGGSLGDRLRGDPLPYGAAARLVETLARAVHHAHLQGVVHRDLKPANVLLDGRGEGDEAAAAALESPTTRPRITDFGLAKRLDRPSTRTSHGDVVGTPSYMAPEQAGTASRDVGPAADVYALGAILYELLTGRPPFKGATAVETVVMVLHREPVRPSSLRPGLPRDLETVCLKCLEKEPARRYESAQALADDLERFQQGRPIAARPAGLAEHAVKWVFRHPLPAVLSAGMVAVALLGFAGVTWQWRLAAAARDTYLEEKSQKEAERQQAEAARAEAAEQRKQARLLLYGSRVAQSQLSWRVNDILGARQALDKCAPAKGQEDRRGWEWRYLSRLYQSAELALAHRQPGAGGAVAWSPLGDGFASVLSSPTGDDSEKAELKAWGADGKERLALAQPGPMHRLAYSPDGAVIALAGADGRVSLSDARTGRETRRWQAHASEVASIAFAPGGKMLATGGWDGALKLWEAATGKLVRRLEGHGDRIQGISFHPVAPRLASAGWDGTVQVWDTGTGERLETLTDHKGPAFCIAHSPDGKLLASASRNGTVRIWDTSTGRPVQTVTGQAGAVLHLAFSPDSRYLAYGGSDASVRVWNIEMGAEQSSLRGHSSPVECVGFSPDGQRLVTCSPRDGAVLVWDMTRHPESGRFARTGADSEAVGFRNEGRLVVTFTAEGALQEWDRATGVLLAERRLNVPVPTASLPGLAAFSPDGELLAARMPGGEGRIGVWATRDGRLAFAVLAHPARAERACFSRDGKLLATAGSGEGRHEVRVWDGRDGRSLGSFAVPSRPVGLAFHPGGEWLAWGGAGGKAGLGNWRTGAASPLPAHKGAAQAMAFSPAGDILASAGASSQTVRLQRLGWENGFPVQGPLRRVPGPQQLCELAFSPDGKRLAGITRDLVKLWDPESSLEALTLRGAPQRYWDAPFAPRVVFSPDGAGLAGTNWNESVSLWESGSPTASPAALSEAKTDFWHVQEAERCLARRNPRAARFHLGLLKGRNLPDPVRRRTESARQRADQAQR